MWVPRVRAHGVQLADLGCGCAALLAGDPLTLQLAGLDPVLEAVDELPPSGSPIPPSAQSRVRQFLTQQLSTGTSAAVQALCVRPKDLQDTKQLHEALQRHANHLHSAVEGYHGVAMPAAAAQLVADAVRTVARQQVVEKNSTAYGLLLDEGYRAGVLAVPPGAEVPCVREASRGHVLSLECWA